MAIASGAAYRHRRCRRRSGKPGSSSAAYAPASPRLFVLCPQSPCRMHTAWLLFHMHPLLPQITRVMRRDAHPAHADARAPWTLHVSGRLSALQWVKGRTGNTSVTVTVLCLWLNRSCLCKSTVHCVARRVTGQARVQVPPGGAADVSWPDLVAAAVNAGAPNMSAASYDAPYAVWKHASMGQMRLVVRAAPPTVPPAAPVLEVGGMPPASYGISAPRVKGLTGCGCPVAGTLRRVLYERYRTNEMSVVGSFVLSRQRETNASRPRCVQVLARRDVMTLLGGASTSCVATGVAGVGLNKGAVAISCQVWGTEICFVNAHLAAHQSRTAERNKMFRVRCCMHGLHACVGVAPV